MRKELLKEMNKQVANLGVAYVKFHNLHWNVIGNQFKPVHVYLEELYDELTAAFDEVAELVRINGELPVARMSDFLLISDVKELDSKEIHFVEALKIALEDLLLLKDQALVIRKLAGDEDLFGIVDSMESFVSNIDKQSWFIRTMLM